MRAARMFQSTSLGQILTWVLFCRQVEQHTSPFELQQIPTLFANFGKKFKHETVDNIPDLAPAVIIFGIMMAYVDLLIACLS